MAISEQHIKEDNAASVLRLILSYIHEGYFCWAKDQRGSLKPTDFGNFQINEYMASRTTLYPEQICDGQNVC